MEIWAPVPSHLRYEISNLGRIKLRPCKLIFLDGTMMDMPPQPKIKTSVSNGYIKVLVDNKYILLHRLIAETFVPNPDKLPYVVYRDGNKLNNVADNLEWSNKKYIDSGEDCRGSGICIRCNETGQIFKSMKAAAANFSIPYNSFVANFHKRASIGGYTFTAVSKS
jgi:hypothetical protein